MKTVLVAVAVVFLLVAAASVVGIVMWAPWKRGTPGSTPVPVASASPAPTTEPSVAPDTAPLAATPQLRIVRLEPPSGPPGTVVTIEAEGAPADAAVFFGPAAATVVSRDGGVIKVEVPNVGAAASAPITLRTGSATSAPTDFAIDTPALPQVTFRYEMRPDAAPPIATVYLGPVPLFVVAAKGTASSTEERARLAALDLDAARTLLAGNTAAGLRIQQGRRTWDVVVAESSGPPLATLCSVGPEEVAFVSAQGQPVTADRLAGYWMSILNDALSIGFGVGRQDRLPEDAPGGAILRRMTVGGLQKGFGALSPEDRAELEALPLRVPAALGGFHGTFRGIAKLDRAAFPEIRWPRVELEIEIAFASGSGLHVPGEMNIKWISTLDDSGLSKSYNKLGTFPVSGTLDPSNLNRLLFSIQHAGVTVPFHLTRKIESATGAVSIEGRYHGSTDFLLKKL